MAMEEESKTLFVHVYTQISRLILLLKSHALQTHKKKDAMKEESMKKISSFCISSAISLEIWIECISIKYLHI